MKKRILALTMAGMLCSSALFGCGGSNVKSSSEGSTSAAKASSESSCNISFIVKLTDGHFSRVMAGAKAYAEENPNVTVDIQSPTSATDYDGQNNMIETTLSNDSYDAMIIAPLQSASAASLIEGTDKVVVSCDTDFTSDLKSAFVGTGNYDAAYSGGKTAAEEAITRGAEAPTAVVLTGVQGDETHDERLEGFTDGVEDAGGSVIEVQYCDALADKAANATEAIIQKYSDGVDIILNTCDDMAVACVKVIGDSGSSAYDDTVICGFDGNQAALEAIRKGTLTMDVAQLGYQMGYKAVEAAVTVLDGGTVDSFIDSGSKIITSDNVEDYVDELKDLGVWEE